MNNTSLEVKSHLAQASNPLLSCHLDKSCSWGDRQDELDWLASRRTQS